MELGLGVLISARYLQTARMWGRMIIAGLAYIRLDLGHDPLSKFKAKKSSSEYT